MLKMEAEKGSGRWNMSWMQRFAFLMARKEGKLDDTGNRRNNCRWNRVLYKATGPREALGFGRKYDFFYSSSPVTAGKAEHKHGFRCK